MANTLILLTLLAIVRYVDNWNKFCSVVCNSQKCNSMNYADCDPNQCQSPWTWNTTTNICEVLPTSGWALVDTSVDTGAGAITPDVGSTGTCGPQSGGSNWAYSYTGNMTGSNTVTYSDPNGPQVAFYQMRVVFWMILIDNWQGSDTIKATINSNTSLVQSMSRNNRQTSEKTCGSSGDWDDYLRFDKTYTFNASMMPYTVAITTNNSGSKWGVKELAVLVKTCNVACTACFGSFITQCYSCEQNTPMLLSGTTCNETCMPGYGMMADNMNCVFCDLKCLVCF